MLTETEELLKEFEKLEIEVLSSDNVDDKIYAITFQPKFLEKIRKYQKEIMSDDVNKLTGEEICTQLDGQGILKFDSRIWIPNVAELKNVILHEAHNSKFSIHPGSTKMYQDLKKNFWWPDMKKDIAE